MKWALLYVLTATVTGLHNFYQLMWMIWGAPINLLNCTALLGSTVLLLAAVLALYRARVTAGVGLAGSILVWVYYGPFLFFAILAPSSFWGDLQFNFKFHDYVPVIGPSLGIPLLVLSTIHSVSALRRDRLGQSVGKSVE
ncbi:MAG TPA: hypothetical protein VLZ50_06220 [Terracidiphilus sp.]|nr:hypothetical protein [Terracidiphilus sp.]